MIPEFIIFLLKFIGTVLLVLLGIMIGLLLVLLFVPVRYRMRLIHGDELQFEGTISWLLHIVHGTVAQDGEKRRIYLRIFGFIVFDTDKPKKPKKLKKRKKTKKSRLKRHNKKAVVDDKRIGLSDKKKSNRIHSSNSLRDGETVHEDEKVHESKAVDEGKAVREEIKPLNTDESIALEGESIGDEENEKTSNGFMGKVLLRIKTIFIRIKEFFNKLMERIRRWITTTLSIKQKISMIKVFFDEEENREALGASMLTLKKLLKHILPTKIRSKLIFGTGDPGSTGQALGILGIFYGRYGEHVHITPDFENKIFEGNHRVKGRIRMSTLLIIVIKLLLDKRFKRLIQNFKILKEAL